MDWAFHESQIRFDIRAEREEYERLFQHPARVLQDRLVRRKSTKIPFTISRFRTLGFRKVKVYGFNFVGVGAA